MSKFHFLHIDYLIFGIPISFIIISVIAFFIFKGNKKFLNFISLSYRKPVKATFKGHWVSFLFLSLALIFLVIALARPRQADVQSNEAGAAFQGVEAVLLADVSRSMGAEDVKPNRLKVMKKYILQLLESGALSRVSLISFSGTPELISPLTFDLYALEDFLKAMGLDHYIFQGTNVAKALKLAKVTLDKGVSGSVADRVIILFSDGEDHSKEALNLAKAYSKEGILIYTLAIGSEKGGAVPGSGSQWPYLKDDSGKVIISKPNFDFLNKVASQTGGKFYHAGYDVQSIVSSLTQDLKRLQAGDSGAVAYGRYASFNEHYKWPLLFSLIFLMLELFSPLYLFRKKMLSILLLTFFIPFEQASAQTLKNNEAPLATLEFFKSRQVFKFLEDKDLETAILAYQDILKTSPLNWTIHHNLGLVFILNKDFQSAQAQFEFNLDQAQNLDQRKRALMSLAFVQGQLKLIDQALESYQKLLELLTLEEERLVVHKNIELLLKSQSSSGEGGDKKKKDKDKKGNYSSKDQNESKQMNKKELKAFEEEVSANDAKVRKENKEKEKRGKKLYEKNEKPW